MFDNLKKLFNRNDIQQENFDAQHQKFLDMIVAGNNEYVSQEIKNGINVDAMDGYAITLASQYGHTLIVKQLLNAGSDVGLYGKLALTLALSLDESHVDLVDLLIEESVAKEHHIYRAIGYGKTKFVKSFLNAGYKIRFIPEKTLDALRAKGYNETVKLVKQSMSKNCPTQRQIPIMIPKLVVK